MTTIAQALQQACQQLETQTARLDAELLLAQKLGYRRSQLYVHAEQELDTAIQQDFFSQIEKHKQGWPLAYLLGTQEFFSLPFTVSEATLIPRPDTETLVETALEIIRKIDMQHILDLGTGSGAIAVALAHTVPDLQVTATDISTEALAVAQANGEQLGVSTIRWLRSHWFARVAGKFEMIVSNPPYIAADDPHLKGLTHEPSTALVSGLDGLDAIREIVAEAVNYLQPQGWLLLEHGFDQAEAVRNLLLAQGFVNVSTRRDLAGNDRVSLGQWREG